MPLIERLEITYLPSASALAWLSERRDPAKLLLTGFGDPELPANNRGTGSLADRFTSRFALAPLPATARELATISRLLPGKSEIRTGGEATEDALRHATARGARVVHLATHTVIDERPGQGAAILLTPDGDDDGLLRPAEIAQLEYHADLTVLAACRSALGGVEDGRAFASLTGSLLAVGSSAVIASLWDVGDEASAAFMEQLYYHLSRGATPAAALRRTKLRLRSDPAWNRPDLWGAFILIGDAPAIVQARRIPLWAWVAAALILGLLLASRWSRRRSDRHR